MTDLTAGDAKYTVSITWISHSLNGNFQLEPEFIPSGDDTEFPKVRINYATRLEHHECGIEND